MSAKIELKKTFREKLILMVRGAYREITARPIGPVMSSPALLLHTATWSPVTWNVCQTNKKF